MRRLINILAVVAALLWIGSARADDMTLLGVSSGPGGPGNGQTGSLLLVAGGANQVWLIDGASNLCLTGSVTC